MKKGTMPTKTNIFSDVGLPEEYLAKAEIVMQIEDIIKRGKMTQSEAAKRLGIAQPRVSDLLRGRLDLFSLDKLMRFVRELGNSVQITIKAFRQSKSRGPNRTLNRGWTFSYQDRLHHFSAHIGKAEVAALKLKRQPLMIHSETLQHRSLNIVHMDRVRCHVIAEIVRLPV